MKTIQISDELWKRLRVAAAERGVTMREVVEEMGSQWQVRPASARRASAGLQAQKPGPAVVAPESVRELKVELED